MSIDRPNKYEQAIEDYAAAYREEVRLLAEFRATQTAHREAEIAKQDRWRVVASFRNDGLVKPGFYRLYQGTGLWAHGVMVTSHGDYPDVTPMFR